MGAGAARPHRRDARDLARNLRAARTQGFHGGPGIGELIDVVRESALDKKGEAFTALDVSGRTILADAFAIVTGRSKIQTRAIADAITEAARRDGYAVSRVEGYADGSWILIDLGHVIVHVFTPDQRAFYNLERLWSSPNAASSVAVQRT